MLSFKYWIPDELERNFGLRRVRADQMNSLPRWLASKAPVGELENRSLNEMSQRLNENVEAWNEEDLKMKFIGPLMELVNIDNEQFRSFYNPVLEGKVENTEMGGVVDMLVATGRSRPYEPFFFLNEYKPEKRGTSDPLGQLLAAMLLAQSKNTHVFPVYGAYIVGRNWFFVVLEEKNYAVSNQFNAGNPEEALTVFRVLRQVKENFHRVLEAIEQGKLTEKRKKDEYRK